MLELAIKLTELRNYQTLEVIERTIKKVLLSAPPNTFKKTFKMSKILGTKGTKK